MPINTNTAPVVFLCYVLSNNLSFKNIYDKGNKIFVDFSSVHVIVVHAICGVKKYRILKERFRCRKLGFDDLVILIACGLHNLKIKPI
jgi:hypothetical protein